MYVLDREHRNRPVVVLESDLMPIRGDIEALMARVGAVEEILHSDKLAYSVKEAEVVTGISDRELDRQIERGALIARKLGRKTVLLRGELLAWLEALPMWGETER